MPAYLFLISELANTDFPKRVDFIPRCGPGWQGDLGHVPLSALTQFPSCKMGSECNLWESDGKKERTSGES